jgi:hypothetical protein
MDTTLSEAIMGRKALYALYILYPAATIPIRLSILLFYRRLSPSEVRPIFAKVIWGCMGFIVVYSLAIMIVACLTCLPVVSFWRLIDTEWTALHEFHCRDETPIYQAQILGVVVQDVTTWLMPIIILARLRLQWPRKMALGLLFGIGLL